MPTLSTSRIRLLFSSFHLDVRTVIGAHYKEILCGSADIVLRPIPINIKGPYRLGQVIFHKVKYGLMG